MAVQTDGTLGGEFLCFVPRIIVKATSLAAKKGANTGTDDEKNGIEYDCHEIIVSCA